MILRDWIISPKNFFFMYLIIFFYKSIFIITFYIFTELQAITVRQAREETISKQLRI